MHVSIKFYGRPLEWFPLHGGMSLFGNWRFRTSLSPAVCLASGIQFVPGPIDAYYGVTVKLRGVVAPANVFCNPITQSAAPLLLSMLAWRWEGHQLGCVINCRALCFSMFSTSAMVVDQLAVVDATAQAQWDCIRILGTNPWKRD